MKIEGAELGINVKVTVDEETAIACLHLLEIYCHQKGKVIKQMQDDEQCYYFYDLKESESE